MILSADDTETIHAMAETVWYIVRWEAAEVPWTDIDL